MLSCANRHRFWSLIFTAYFAGVGLLGFSGIAWCLDWSINEDDQIELTASHTEMSGSGIRSFPTCVVDEPANSTRCSTCLDIAAQSVSGWRTADDQLTFSAPILPDRTRTTFLQLSALKSFAGKSLPAFLASGPSLSLTTIQSKSLRAVVLLI